MAISELHSRLEHLVNYSSQLIFVSGDKINQQTQIIEAFLGHQSENAEVAIVQATEDVSLNEYRSQIFKQLMGRQAPGDFSLPLDQLLADLNGYDGPVLISISHAENLPQKLLQELWELVLQSRFASNKQHLNVLLFADPQWAEQAKSWLPANTGNKPILLSSQSISNAETDVSQTELEKLIHTKREQFAERIKGRAQHYEPINPVLAKRWLLSLVGIVFISVFGGMLWWQYPQAPSSLLTQISMIFSKPGKASTETPSMAEQLPPQGIRQAFPVPAVSQADRVANDPSDALTKQAITPGSIEEKAVDPNALVTDWQSAVRQIDKAARNQGKTDVALPLATPLIQSRAAQNTGKKRIVGSKLQSQDANIPLNGQAVRPADELRPPARDGVVDDYQVQDITSVAQLTVQTTAVKAFVPLSEIAAVPRPNTGKQGRKMPIYEYNEETLLSLPEDKYLLQIAAMSKVQTMREYIQDNQLQAKLWIYKTQRQGNDWFVLLHNTDYLSPLAASQASASLPLAMRQGVPFAKTSRQVQTEINQTKN